MGKQPMKTVASDSEDEIKFGVSLEDIEDRTAVLRKRKLLLAYSNEDFRDKFVVRTTGLNPHRNKGIFVILRQSAHIEILGYTYLRKIK